MTFSLSQKAEETATRSSQTADPPSFFQGAGAGGHKAPPGRPTRLPTSDRYKTIEKSAWPIVAARLFWGWVCSCLYFFKRKRAFSLMFVSPLSKYRGMRKRLQNSPKKM